MQHSRGPSRYVNHNVIPPPPSSKKKAPIENLAHSMHSAPATLVTATVPPRSLSAYSHLASAPPFPVAVPFPAVSAALLLRARTSSYTTAARQQMRLLLRRRPRLPSTRLLLRFSPCRANHCCLLSLLASGRRWVSWLCLRGNGRMLW